MSHICKHCGSQTMKIEKGKPPHLASLICCNCNRWHKWLSKREITAIELEERERDRREDKQETLDLYGW